MPVALPAAALAAPALAVAAPAAAAAAPEVLSAVGGGAAAGGGLGLAEIMKLTNMLGGNLSGSSQKKLASFLAAGISGLKLPLAAYQYLMGRGMAKGVVRPQYEIPKTAYDNLNMTQLAALEGMSAQEKERAIQEFQRAGQFGLTALRETDRGPAGVAELAQVMSDQQRNLAMQSEQLKRAARQELSASQAQMAQYKDKEWQLNEFDPYKNKAAAAAALQEAGIKNAYSGIDTTASNLMAAALYGNNKKTKTV